MTTTTATLAIIAAVLALAGIVTIVFYNAFVRGRNALDEAWSGIGVQLKRRHDLVPNLVSTVKGYASHEQQTLQGIAEARASAVAAGKGSVEDVLKAENALSQSLRSLFAVVENYPELKANQNFSQLQGTLAEIEDEIQMARRYYNATARDQNNRVQTFPGNVLAGMFGFGKAAFFELDGEEDKANPQVRF